MSDEDLRGLERAWRVSSSPDDYRRWAAAAARAGDWRPRAFVVAFAIFRHARARQERVREAYGRISASGARKLHLVRRLEEATTRQGRRAARTLTALLTLGGAPPHSGAFLEEILLYLDRPNRPRPRDRAPPPIEPAPLPTGRAERIRFVEAKEGTAIALAALARSVGAAIPDSRMSRRNGMYERYICPICGIGVGSSQLGFHYRRHNWRRCLLRGCPNPAPGTPGWDVCLQHDRTHYVVEFYEQQHRALDRSVDVLAEPSREDLATVFTNEGSAGSVSFTLPSGDRGTTYEFDVSGQPARLACSTCHEVSFGRTAEGEDEFAERLAEEGWRPSPADPGLSLCPRCVARLRTEVDGIVDDLREGNRGNG